MDSGERKAGYPSSQGYAALIAGYGMDHAQLEALRKNQSRNEVKMIPALGDVKNYKIPAHDLLHVYHVSVEAPIHDQATGERIDRLATVQQYNIAAFKHVEKFGGFSGKKVKILHNPEVAQELVAEEMAAAKKKKDSLKD